MLTLLSETPIFHAFALEHTTGEEDSDLTRFLKLRMYDLHIGDPNVKPDMPTLALTASKPVDNVAETDIPTGKITRIDLNARA